MSRLRALLVGTALLALTLSVPASPPVVPAPPSTPAAAALGVTNGQPRLTVDGSVIDAHDGEIRKFGTVYYLYGTAYACGFRWTDPSTQFCGFNVYTSPDLVQWTGPARLFDPSGSWQALCMHGTSPGWGCFRPHVLFNAATQLYVLWVNVPGGYRALTSPSPAGPFTPASTPQVAGGDMGLFADTDGTAYLLYSSDARIYERRLTAGYLDVTGSAIELAGFPQVGPYYGAEAPTMFSRKGIYYALVSVPRCPYCSGTGSGYFMAPSAFGPWTYQGLISDWSCNGQPAAVSQLDDVYLLQSDQWLQTPNEYAAHQFWGPLSFEGGRILPLSCTVGSYPNLAYFPWYDNADPAVHSANIHIVNPASNGQVAAGAISAGGQLIGFSIPAGQEWFGRFRPGTLGGPVQVGSNVRVIASQRTQYGDSFNESPAQPAAAAAPDLYFSWFDRISSPGFRADNVHVVNPSALDAAVTVTIPGQPGCSPTAIVRAGGGAVFTCPTGFGGPVHVHSDQPVLASQRTTYFQTFNEVNGQGGAGATSLLWSWYDHASSALFAADNIHVISPGGSLPTSNVRVAIPGCPAPDLWQYSSAEWIYSCPPGQGFGGPVTVTADAPVLASQRVQYGSSFNELSAQGPSQAGLNLYMPWFDQASSSAFTGDNVHVVAPSGSLTPAALSVTIPGCSPSAWQVSPAEIVYSCPAGQGFGGPVLVRSSVPVLASQRVEYLQSFNETVASG